MKDASISTPPDVAPGPPAADETRRRATSWHARMWYKGPGKIAKTGRLMPTDVIEASQDVYTEEEMTMRTLVQFIVVMALALLTNVAAAQEMGTATAKLTGDAEVPGPGDPKGSGTIQVTLDPAKGEVCYELSVANMQEATAAHIHEGAKGQEGPVKVPLQAPKTGAAKGCAKVDAVVIETIMKDPADYYVNIHNAAFPKGAVRGQLSK
jgi:hypothetical protein